MKRNSSLPGAELRLQGVAHTPGNRTPNIDVRTGSQPEILPSDSFHHRDEETEVQRGQITSKVTQPVYGLTVISASGMSNFKSYFLSDILPRC